MFVLVLFTRHLLLMKCECQWSMFQYSPHIVSFAQRKLSKNHLSRWMIINTNNIIDLFHWLGDNTFFCTQSLLRPICFAAHFWLFDSSRAVCILRDSHVHYFHFRIWNGNNAREKHGGYTQPARIQLVADVTITMASHGRHDVSNHR